MSWTPELTPQSLEPTVLVSDLLADSRSYRAAGFGPKDRLTFLCLRVLQRLAYHVGWKLGRRRRLRYVQLGQDVLGGRDAAEDAGMH